MRRRFWLEASACTIVGMLAVLTLVWPDWIEGLTGADPDGGDGGLEWVLVLGLALISTASALLARREWSRGRLAADQRS